MGRFPVVTLALTALLLAGCNQYELFRLSGYQQESFSNQADILFVIDNSDSMTDEAAALATNFASFIELLQAQEDEIVREDLGDAVSNYQSYVQDRTSFVDFQIGITTTEVEVARGELLGAHGQEILSRGDPKLADKFVENLLCDATCFRGSSDIKNDPSHQCGDPLGDELTVQYLDCVCGAGNWRDVNCAESGREEGLEAVFLALCRAVPNPPSTCFDGTQAFDGSGEVPSLFTQADKLSNDGLVRPRSTFIPVIVSDEGDDSRREAPGNGLAGKYQQLFDSFSPRLSWVTITPPLSDTGKPPTGCIGYTDWGALRYDYMVRVSNGLKINISEPRSGECPTTDFGDALAEFGQLLRNLLTVFELQSVPDPDSILVFIEGDEIPRAEQRNTDKYGLPVYGDGWTYEIELNAIRFHGSAIPENDAVVQVYYLPVDGMPREFPL